MQPRWLVSQLEELDYQTDYQLELVGSLLQQAQALNRLSLDYIGFAKSDVFAIHELYDSLEQAYQAASQQAQMRHRRVEEQSDNASSVAKHSSQSLDDAHALKQTWQQQTEMAESWLSQAQTHLSACIEATRQARVDSDRADSELSRAETQLRIARAGPRREVYVGKDSQGRAIYESYPPDTSYEEGRVAAAQSQVNACRAALNRAVSAQQAAVAERDRADAQLHGARQALADASTSVDMAEQALELAHDGQRQASSSLSYSQHCLQVLEEVKTGLQQFKQTCQQQSDVLAQLDNQANQALLQLRDVANSQEAIQGEAFSLKYTLQDKAALLLAFDQPLGRR